MPIPTRFNPMGKSNRPQAFELVVKPGILASDMTYGFTPYWNAGGYCSVDWGDGAKEDAVSNKTKLNHTYAVAGTYRVKINADLYLIKVGGAVLYDCNEKWECLGCLGSGSFDMNSMFESSGNLIHTFKTLPQGFKYTNYMFRYCSKVDFAMASLPEGITHSGSMFSGCTNATLPLTSLPESLNRAPSMFSGCTKATLPLTSLPDGLSDATQMFDSCKNAEINLDTLVANAPDEGWTKLTSIRLMFRNCSKVTGSRSAFLAKCPNVTNTTDAFTGTSTTE